MDLERLLPLQKASFCPSTSAAMQAKYGEKMSAEEAGHGGSKIASA